MLESRGAIRIPESGTATKYQLASTVSSQRLEEAGCSLQRGEGEERKVNLTGLQVRGVEGHEFCVIWGADLS